MSDSYKVITPENVELDYEIAGIGTRFLAITVDTLIQALFAGALVTGLSLFGIDKLDLHHKIPNFNISIIAGLIIIFLFVVNFGYFIILESVMNGQTIGKKLLNIRVRQDGGGAPGFWEILLRNIVRIVDYLPAFYTFGIIVMFLNPKAKRMGDFAAGTVVVKELPRKKASRFLNEVIGVQKNNENIIFESKYPWVKSILPFVTQQDYLLIKNILSRRKQLSNFSSLAYEVINNLLIKAGLKESISIPMETAEVLELIAQMYEISHLH